MPERGDHESHGKERVIREEVVQLWRQLCIVHDVHVLLIFLEVSKDSAVGCFGLCNDHGANFIRAGNRKEEG